MVYSYTYHLQNMEFASCTLIFTQLSNIKTKLNKTNDRSTFLSPALMMCFCIIIIRYIDAMVHHARSYPAPHVLPSWPSYISTYVIPSGPTGTETVYLLGTTTNNAHKNIIRNILRLGQLGHIILYGALYLYMYQFCAYNMC